MASRDEPQVRAEMEQRSLPSEQGGWQPPTEGELEALDEPRHYTLPQGVIMGLTLDAIGLYNAPVIGTDGPQALAQGVVHVPETSLPWDEDAQKNVYLAGHRMGYRGTWSRLIFYRLNKVTKGDLIVLKDRRGKEYDYRVSETFLAEPSDSWVMGEVRGRDMLTLQTCTPIPTFEKRLIVRADRV
jgi:sortase A